jgi:hypothetical protein
VASSEAVGRYLVARQLQAHERNMEAAELLSSVDLARLPTERVRAEALRLLALARYLSGDRAGALEVFELLAADRGRPQGSRDVAADWVDLIRRSAR